VVARRISTAGVSSSAKRSINIPLHCSVAYPGMGLAPLVAVLALAVFAFYTSLGGKKVFQGNLLED